MPFIARSSENRVLANAPHTVVCTSAHVRLCPVTVTVPGVPNTRPPTTPTRINSFWSSVNEPVV